MDNAVKYFFFCTILFLLGGMMMLSYRTSVDNKEVKKMECFTSYGETKNIILNDGTQVTLKPGSILLYPDAFNERERYVYMKGEAVFDISDDMRPFVLNSGDKRIISEGNSSFVFISFNNDSLLRVIPLSGDVKLFNGNAKKGRVLPVNVRTEINNNTGKVGFFRTTEYKNELYKKGSIVFQNEPLDFIVNTLIRTYNKDLNYNLELCKGNRYTVTFFPYSDVNETIKVLNTITGVSVF